MHSRGLRFRAVVALLGVACAETDERSTSSEPASGVAATTASDIGAVRAAIESANARFTSAVKRGDTTALGSDYTEDVVFMWPNMPALRGRDSVRKWWAGELSRATVREFTLEAADVTVAGDLALETGTYEMKIQPKTGNEVLAKGNYLTVWKRQSDGSWKVLREIDNSSLPARS